jgi:hypothetical protein
MSQLRTLPAALSAESRPLVLTSAKAVSIPRTIWLTAAGMLITVTGGTWDFAWHMSIGRDAAWIPPHVLVQVGGVLVGIACAYTILSTTFAGTASERNASIQILGFRGPAGAFIAIWGSLTMFVSEPFDNWWHNAYGLDVKFVSPPHGLLFIGSLAIKIGALAWIASMMSRSVEPLSSRLRWVFLFVGSLGVTQFAKLIIGNTGAENMHTADCYLVVAVFIPPILLAAGWGAVHKWGCTITAAIYTAIGLGSEWLLPLFPAQPKLGPVYHNVTHLIPMGFPLLLIVPALVTDLLLQKLEQRSSWFKALCIGPAFLVSFFAVQWPFADFLMSPAARNWVFGRAYFAYSDPAGFLYDPYKFEAAGKTLGAVLVPMALGFLASILTTRFGLGWGNWMRRVRR